ncbi:acyl-CoA thioester hydrolase [Gelidibacter sediminis]|uniref:Acyl-CoA thioester hydrolase n=1 Tax=Gelidibacter sediminis TaxID=1608710 RepID=A0A4R7Q216_9FLAO|nr:thioesterase family protein [Gelidibacter sediminis]TDU40520.1 acyl-CoA thioester hydrolase [Gelidibacter sediminis]
MQSFEIQITVTQEDLDNLNHVNNVRYVQWVQDVAEKHWHAKATKNILSDYVWILLNHNIAYKNPAVLGDVLTLKTYIKEAGGVTCLRIVDIYNKDTDKLLASSETKWCLVTQANMKPARITDTIRALFS